MEELKRSMQSGMVLALLITIISLYSVFFHGRKILLNSFSILVLGFSQAQAMKEQAQLREEMAYQYKLGNFEVVYISTFKWLSCTSFLR